ncbi:hypothetical protein BS17DRAFT_77151 [Gyrodon lividus]|nr:hypothetical protein BS17DRAFT_77151 [Gyrodon lividus]
MRIKAHHILPVRKYHHLSPPHHLQPLYPCPPHPPCCCHSSHHPLHCCYHCRCHFLPSHAPTPRIPPPPPPPPPPHFFLARHPLVPSQHLHLPRPYQDLAEGIRSSHMSLCGQCHLLETS